MKAGGHEIVTPTMTPPSSLSLFDLSNFQAVHSYRYGFHFEAEKLLINAFTAQHSLPVCAGARVSVQSRFSSKFLSFNVSVLHHCRVAEPGPASCELRVRTTAREGRESLQCLTLPLPRKPTRAR